MSSTTTSTQTRKAHRQRLSAEDGDKGIWSSMLDSVATGKKLAEKNLIILGGDAESQKEFLDTISQDSTPQARRPQDRNQSKRPPLANRFALGYTYQDILDADQDDILARLSLYLLADRDPAFSSLLEPLFTPAAIPDTLVVILLDWSNPWTWLRQLRDWIRILRAALARLDNTAKDALDENMKEWTERQKGVPVEGVSATDSAGAGPPPLGPGEWDEALGIPLCVVCTGAEKTETLERDAGWRDAEFDAVLQFLRTVLLKHGGSLIYTSTGSPGALGALLRASLGITSLLQRAPLKHNVIDRDKILIPPNWDSWGKIRILAEGFDIESVSEAWSVDIQASPAAPSLSSPTPGDTAQATPGSQEATEDSSTAVAAYERTIQDPSGTTSTALTLGSNGLRPGDAPHFDTACQDTQEFLSSQASVLEQLKGEDEREGRAKEASKRPTATGASTPTTPGGPQTTGSRVNEHIGPVQFNMGGIQVDADDMLRGLRERNDGARGGSDEGGAADPASPEGRTEHEKLSSFFAGLMSRGSASAGNSPKTSTPRLRSQSPK